MHKPDNHVLNLMKKIFKCYMKENIYIHQNDVDTVIHKLSCLKSISDIEKEYFFYIFGVDYTKELITRWITDYCKSYGVNFIEYNKRELTLLHLAKHFDNFYKVKAIERSIEKSHRYPNLQIRNKLLLEDTISSMLLEQEQILTSTNNGLLYYRKECQFILNYISLVKIKGYDKLVKYGWYHPIHNPFGVTKDHRYSVNAGFNNRVDPKLLRHPTNCEFLSLRENSSKNDNCSITLEELHELIAKYKNSVDISE